jgi:hypothetical protein
VVSFFAIHHVRDKRRLIGDVYERYRRAVDSSTPTSPSLVNPPLKGCFATAGLLSCVTPDWRRSVSATSWLIIETTTCQSLRRNS